MSTPQMYVLKSLKMVLEDSNIDVQVNVRKQFVFDVVLFMRDQRRILLVLILITSPVITSLLQPSLDLEV